MRKKHVLILVSNLIMILLAWKCIAAPKRPIIITAISANGFSCSADSIDSAMHDLITCSGSFPNHPYPVQTTSGFLAVTIQADYEDLRWTYYSDNGCLCKKDFKHTVDVCKSRYGDIRDFHKTGGDSVKWCESYVHR